MIRHLKFFYEEKHGRDGPVRRGGFLNSKEPLFREDLQARNGGQRPQRALFSKALSGKQGERDGGEEWRRVTLTHRETPGLGEPPGVIQKT